MKKISIFAVSVFFFVSPLIKCMQENYSVETEIQERVQKQLDYYWIDSHCIEIANFQIDTEQFDRLIEFLYYYGRNMNLVRDPDTEYNKGTIGWYREWEKERDSLLKKTYEIKCQLEKKRINSN